MIDLAAIPYVAAKYQWSRPAHASVDLIVIHDMEAPEKGDTAERVARYFAAIDRTASCHYCVDADSIVCCVAPDRMAAHAPGANENGIGIEHAGYANQSMQDWLDDYGRSMLDRSAQLVAALCRRYDIPPRWLDASALLASARPRGITTHAAVTWAYRRGDHTDPGPNFPVVWYLDRIRSLTTPAATPEVHHMIALTRNDDGRLEEFRLVDESLSHRWQIAPGQAWSGWDPMGSPDGRTLVDVGAATNADGRIEVVCLAADGTAWRRWQTAPGQAFAGWCPA